MSLVFFILGFGWMGLFSIHALQANIDEKYFNTSINVVSTTENISKISKHKTQFIFNVIEPFNATIELAWYGKSKAKLRSDDQWKFLIKIKHNNSYQNKGGFDFEWWLFFKKFDANGYVR